MTEASSIIFPDYLQQKRRIPRGAWQLLRGIGILLTAGFTLLCFRQPELALLVFWGLVVPLLPAVFWFVPGAWRNLCPLAAVNQLPRDLGISQGRPLPDTLHRLAPTIALVTLLLVIVLRRPLFDHSASALGILVIATLSLALLGGIFFKGKSGWCTSFCPVLPVERLLGQTPVVMSPNSHCSPCVACTRNCYDFNPQAALLADLYDKDRRLVFDRRLLSGAMPGIIIAYFTAPAGAGFGGIALLTALYALVGFGLCFSLQKLLQVSPPKIAALSAAICLNAYYWFSGPVLQTSLNELGEWQIPDSSLWVLRILLLLLTLLWMWRTFLKDNTFLTRLFVGAASNVGAEEILARECARWEDAPLVTVEPGGARIVARGTTTLLSLLEANQAPVRAGCRLGSCGADPVTIIEGAENLSPAGDEERMTLQRLGLGPHARMACCAKVQGPVRVDLSVQATAGFSAGSPDFDVDAAVKRVVVVGNGIAGVNAADTLRRCSEQLEIHLVGAEKYPLYNRMAITSLIHEQGDAQQLALLPENWYSDRSIQCHLDTRALEIDSKAREVTLQSGEKLSYDRLILTSGSDARSADIEGFGLPGSFVLRGADDALSMRQFIEQSDIHGAVVIGGGVLGLEAATGLLRRGIGVTLLESADRLMSRQLDVEAATRLGTYLEGIGLNFLCNARVDKVSGDSAIESVQFNGGIELATKMVLLTTGTTFEPTLARSAGINVGEGILVDSHLCSSDSLIYAAGDVARVDGALTASGLWPVAAKQGRVAARNALGANEHVEPRASATILKIAGIDLVSIGEFEAATDDEVIVQATEQKYRKLVLRGGHLVGAILLGYPEITGRVCDLVSQGCSLDAELAALRGGNWDCFLGA